MKNILLKIAIAWMVAQGAAAGADELRVVNSGGLYGVSAEDAQAIYKCAAPYFKKVGVTFRMKYYAFDFNPCYEKHSLVSRAEELKCFEPLASNRRRVITYMMTSPFLAVNEQTGARTSYIGGIAKFCGTLSTGNATSNVVTNDVIGASRIQHSATILGHEVMHNLCAHHAPDNTDGPVANLMHPNANKFTDQYGCNLPVLKVTRQEVKRWYIKNRR